MCSRAVKSHVWAVYGPCMGRELEVLDALPRVPALRTKNEDRRPRHVIPGRPYHY